MTIEYKAKTGRLGGLNVTQSHVENWEARIALGIIEKFGLVAAEPDGTDETGRQKQKLLSPDQVVERAFSIAELAVQEITKRGWLIPVLQTQD